MRVIKATGAPISFEIVDNVKDKVTPEALASVRKNQVAIKGEFVTGVGKGTLPSVNIELRKALGLYANVVHSFNLPGVPTRHENVDIVVIRENVEGEYSGMEHEVAPGITESLKVMTREGTRRIAAYAFEYAVLNNRSKVRARAISPRWPRSLLTPILLAQVTAVHKANIMKKADGIFLESCAEMARLYPSIEYEEVIVDNCMMQLVSKPQQFDVMVTPNFYGSLVTNAVSGLVGGPGIAPGANVGLHAALFEQGARHAAMDIAGKGVMNPTGILLSSVMMLRHMKLQVFADRMQRAVLDTIESGKCRTQDIQGGTATTAEFLDAICGVLENDSSARRAAKKSKGVSKSV
jgi:isocitrate dehydrogenase (NAD+)